MSGPSGVDEISLTGNPVIINPHENFPGSVSVIFILVWDSTLSTTGTTKEGAPLNFRNWFKKQVKYHCLHFIDQLNITSATLVLSI